MSALLHIRNLDLVLGADRLERGDIALRGDRILGVGSTIPSVAAPDFVVEGIGFTAYPGLINAHEHLVGTWSPRTGWGPHENVYSWLDKYMVHTVRQERIKVPERLIYSLGMYRNLFSGVTTILDHFQRVDPSLLQSMPLRVPTDYGREWVMRSHTDPDRYPSWGEGIQKEVASTKGEVPFVIHISEGVDEECRGELARLEAMGGLEKNTVLVHGVAFSPSDIERVAATGASVVWCPGSNSFLYGRTVDVKALLSAGIRVALGTDSTITGTANLLEELQSAREIYKEKYSEELPASEAVKMVTETAAAVIMAEGELGWLAQGAFADLLLLEGEGSDPFERLMEASPRQIDLLIASGRPVLGSRRHESLFQAAGAPHSRVHVQGQEKLVVGDPGALLAEIRSCVGAEKRFHFLPMDGA